MNSSALGRGPIRPLPGTPVSPSVYPDLNCKLRPVGIAALEDKIVQHAVTTVLNAIYEADFLGFSTDSGRGEGSTKRWTHSGSESISKE